MIQRCSSIGESEHSSSVDGKPYHQMSFVFTVCHHFVGDSSRAFFRSFLSSLSLCEMILFITLYLYCSWAVHSSSSRSRTLRKFCSSTQLNPSHWRKNRKHNISSMEYKIIESVPHGGKDKFVE